MSMNVYMGVVFLFNILRSVLQIRWGKRGNPEIIFFYFAMKTCCDPSLEMSRQDGSDVGSQHTFLLRNMENYP